MRLPSPLKVATTSTRTMRKAMTTSTVRPAKAAKVAMITSTELTCPEASFRVADRDSRSVMVAVAVAAAAVDAAPVDRVADSRVVGSRVAAIALPKA
jgi:hypothetical protein